MVLGFLLVPEQKVVLDTDPVRARSIGRPVVENPYLGLVNYTTNLRSLGITDDDLADGGSDHLIDALVAHGDAGTVAARVTEHLDAGADHVAVQLLTSPGHDPVPGFTALAKRLLRLSTALNDTNTRYPGTDLTLAYSIKSHPALA